jgi:hypothetical protein
MLLVVAVIHLLPVSGAIGSEHLTRLYGLSFSEPNLAILMRHRAVLFGLLGMLFLIAAFVPPLQVPAFFAGFISVGSFLLIARLVGGYNLQVGRVFAADVVAAACLVIGVVAYALARRTG